MTTKLTLATLRGTSTALASETNRPPSTATIPRFPSQPIQVWSLPSPLKTPEQPISPHARPNSKTPAPAATQCALNPVSLPWKKSERNAHRLMLKQIVIPRQTSRMGKPEEASEFITIFRLQRRGSTRRLSPAKLLDGVLS